MDPTKQDVYLVFVDKEPSHLGLYGAAVSQITSWPDRGNPLAVAFGENAEDAIYDAVNEAFFGG
jgi:hypothetical protein